MNYQLSERDFHTKVIETSLWCVANACLHKLALLRDSKKVVSVEVDRKSLHNLSFPHFLREVVSELYLAEVETVCAVNPECRTSSIVVVGCSCKTWMSSCFCSLWCPASTCIY